MGDYFEQFLDAQLHELGLTREDLVAWRPAARKTRKFAARSGGRQTGQAKRAKISAKVADVDG